jgi:hypothetical protein
MVDPYEPLPKAHVITREQRLNEIEVPRESPRGLLSATIGKSRIPPFCACARAVATKLGAVGTLSLPYFKKNQMASAAAAATGASGHSGCRAAWTGVVSVRHCVFRPYTWRVSPPRRRGREVRRVDGRRIIGPISHVVRDEG